MTTEVLKLKNNKKDEFISETECNDSSISQKGQIKDQNKECNSTKIYVKDKHYEKDSLISQVIEINNKNKETQNNKEVSYKPKDIEEEDKVYDVIDNNDNNGVNTKILYRKNKKML